MDSIHPWTEARTLTGFGHCVALWLEGSISHMPTRAYCASVSAETAPIVPLLARLNRSGKFITQYSQPSCTPDNTEYVGSMPLQRAALQGFVPATAIRQVCRLLISLDDVEFKVADPGSSSRRSRQLVSKKGNRNITWFGNVLSPAEIAENYGGTGASDCPGLQQAVIRALQSAYQVSFFDGKWGRNVLWPALEELI